MEKGMSTVVDYMREKLYMQEVDLKTYSPLTLAYMGDGFFDLIIRTKVVTDANVPVNKLHRKVSDVVRAQAQSALIESILEELSEEEMSVYKRGKNAKSNTTAKNANLADYKKATGLEALLGYLYLKQDMKRAVDLVALGLENTGFFKNNI